MAKREKGKALKKIGKKIDIFIDKSYENFIPGLTTVAKSALKGEITADAVGFLSNVAQRGKKSGYLVAVKTEWEKLAEEGRIDQEYSNSEIGQMCMVELLDFLDKDLPSDKKFEAMKNIFLQAATQKKDKWNNPQPLHLMKVCRQMEAAEIIILSTLFKGKKEKTIAELNKISSADQWPSEVSKASGGLVTKGIVDFYEQPMIDKRLIGDRNYTDRSGIKNIDRFRLTDLGLELAEFLENK